MLDKPKIKIQLNESVAGNGFYSVYLVLLSQITSTRTARHLMLGGIIRSKQALEQDLV